MNHTDAIESNAAEGYLLGDLSDAERDAFEEHYFDCRVCTNTIRAGAAMFAAGREVVKSRKVIPFPVRWIPARAVAAALAVVVGIQAFVISKVPTASPLPVMEIVTPGPEIVGVTRAGESDVLVRFENDQSVEVYLHIPPDLPYASYRIELRDPSGKVIGVTTASGTQVRNQDSLQVLLRPLPAGRYVLVIEGVQQDGNRSPISSSRVVVQ